MLRARRVGVLTVVAVLSWSGWVSAGTAADGEVETTETVQGAEKITLSPAEVAGGASSTATVTISSAATSGGTRVNLTSSDPAVASLSASSITIPAGKTAESFTIYTTPVNSTVTVTISATHRTTVTAKLTVSPPYVGSVSFSPATITGTESSSGTVTLSSAAAAGGITVGLASSNAEASIPSTVTVPAGATSAKFSATTDAVAVQMVVSITASLNGTSQSATLTIEPPVVASLSFSPETISLNQTTTGTVTLNANAPPGGFPVALTSNDSGALPVPTSVQVAAGANNGTFTAAAGSVTSSTAVSVSASTGSTVVAASITVEPALMASPMSVVFGSGTLVDVPSAQTVTLSNTSAAGITLTSITVSAEFTETNTCPAPLAAGASCVITLTPTQGGSLAGNVSILSSTAGSALVVNLSGTAKHWVALDWTPSSTAGATYDVYRQTQSGGACATPSATTYNLLNTSPLSTTSYNDTDPALVPGDTYCYSVTAVDSGGTSAFTAPPASATIPSP